MSHLYGLMTVSIVICLHLSQGYAQAQGGTSGSSPALGHDYYIVSQSQDPNIKVYLEQVDRNHTDRILEWIRTRAFNNAAADIQYVLERFPNHPKGLQLLGPVSRLLKDPSFGIPYFERAVRSYPQYAFTYAQYGEYLIDIGENGKGITPLKQALEIDPELAIAYVWLARAYQNTGKQDLARQAAEQARALGYTGKIE